MCASNRIRNRSDGVRGLLKNRYITHVCCAVTRSQGSDPLAKRHLVHRYRDRNYNAQSQ